MNEPGQVTQDIGAYFKSFLAGLTGLLALVPVLSALPSDAGKYLFPPLGEITWPARIGAVALTLLAIFVSYVFSAGNSRRRVGFAFASATLFLALFLWLTHSFVRTIDVPSRETSVAVSVGYERTDFANKNFPDESDWEMLRQRGWTDEDVESLWTRGSVAVVRLGLWATCMGFLLSCTFALCFGVLLTR